MKVCEVAKIIENIAPLSLADDWDNVGLLVGDSNAEIKGICIAVDLTNGAINHCISHNCNLIITHHPAIFDPLKSLTNDNLAASLVIDCIKNNINVYSAHTNMDMADEGINFAFAKELGIKPKRFLSDGLGVYGDIESGLDEILLKIGQITKDNEIKVYKSNKEKIAQKERIAFISGSGGRIHEVVDRCCELGITTFISSEFKHNIILELLARNVNVVQVGHFESEVIFVDIIYNLLRNKTNNLYKYVDLI